MGEELRPQDWIIETLLASTSTSPSDLIEELMADSRCPDFGPLHHFIVGATLIACWRNAEANPERETMLRNDLEEMISRSSNVPGATCARWGVCGAAASAGMAYAIVRGNAPLRNEGWQEGQLLGANCSHRLRAREARAAASETLEWQSRQQSHTSMHLVAHR